MQVLSCLLVQSSFGSLTEVNGTDSIADRFISDYSYGPGIELTICSTIILTVTILLIPILLRPSLPRPFSAKRAFFEKIAALKQAKEMHDAQERKKAKQQREEKQKKIKKYIKTQQQLQKEKHKEDLRTESVSMSGALSRILIRMGILLVFQ